MRDGNEKWHVIVTRIFLGEKVKTFTTRFVQRNLDKEVGFKKTGKNMRTGDQARHQPPPPFTFCFPQGCQVPPPKKRPNLAMAV